MAGPDKKQLNDISSLDNGNKKLRELKREAQTRRNRSLSRQQKNNLPNNLLNSYTRKEVDKTEDYQVVSPIDQTIGFENNELAGYNEEGGISFTDSINLEPYKKIPVEEINKKKEETEQVQNGNTVEAQYNPAQELRERVVEAKRQELKNEKEQDTEDSKEEEQSPEQSGIVGMVKGLVGDNASKQLSIKANRLAWEAIPETFGLSIIALDIILFLDYIKGQTRILNTLAVLFVNLVVLILFLLILVIIAMIVSWLDASLLEKAKLLWGLGWEGLEGLISLFAN